MATPSKLTIIFCHGVWADGSCFSKVTQRSRQTDTR